MAQTVQILRASPPATLLPGVLSVELGAATKLWVGSGTGNRLLLSSDPVDVPVLAGAFLKLTGGVLTGLLTLSGPPTTGLHAATKAYVDTGDAATLSSAQSYAVTQDNAVKTYADASATTALNSAKAYADTQDNLIKAAYLPLAGGTLTGPLVLSGPPTINLHPATKLYVDTADNLKAPLASPVFTGDPRAPTPATADNDTSIATTNFVKAQGYATTGALSAGLANYLPLSGGTITGGLTVNGNISNPASSITSAFGTFANAGVTGWLNVGSTLDVTGGITGHNTITTTNAFLGPVLAGGVGNAGVLGCWNTANRIAFRFEAAPGFVYWRIDDAIDFRICTHVNAWNFDHESGGGPTGRQLYYKDNSSNVYSIYVDIVSDDRIKSNIAPTTVDALAVLQQVSISEFDVDARVASWLQTTGQDEDARRQAMDRAEPVHIGIGFVANQLKDVIPEAVTVADQTGASPDSPLPVDMHNVIQQNFTPYIVRAIQQLADRLIALESAP